MSRVVTVEKKDRRGTQPAAVQSGGVPSSTGKAWHDLDDRVDFVALIVRSSALRISEHLGEDKRFLLLTAGDNEPTACRSFSFGIEVGDVEPSKRSGFSHAKHESPLQVAPDGFGSCFNVQVWSTCSRCHSHGYPLFPLVVTNCERRRPLFGGAFGSFVFVQNSRSRRPRIDDEDDDRDKL